MPKSAFKNPFGRRRSSGNVLETAAESPEPGQTTSSFKVLERPEKKITFDGSDRRVHSQIRVNQSRSFASPLQQLRGKSAEDLGFGPNRGSGGTTNSGSSGYFDSSSASARYSSTSTLPSSLDQDREHDDHELFPKKRATAPMHNSVSAAADDSLPPPPSFSSRASRAFSFGLKSKQHQQQALAARTVVTPSLPASPVNGSSDNSFTERSPVRERAMTTSSYASTAVPPKLEAKPDLGSSDFGNDFGTNMFDSLQDKSLPAPPVVGGFHRTVRFDGVTTHDDTDEPQESEPMFPPRSYSRQGFTPSPNQTRNTREDTSSPYRYDDRESQEGLYSTSSALSSPRLDVSPGLPPINNSMAPAFLGGSKPGYSLVSERYASPGFERSSQDSRDGFLSENSKRNEPAYASRQAHLDDGEGWGKKYELKDPAQLGLSTSGSFNSFTATPSSSAPAPRQHLSAVAGASRAGATSPGSSDGEDLFTTESRNTTPKATRLLPKTNDSLFDASPSGPPSRAIRPGPGSHQLTEGGTPKKMSKAQFEILQRHGNSSNEQSEDDTHSGDEYDDEDESERAKKVTTQRRKQEANMAVYRQQMKKVTGGGPSDLPNARPGYDRNASNASGLHLGGMGGAPPTDTFRGKHSDEEEDEDVPLGILQAHGFPSGFRPPTQSGDGARSVMNGGAGQGNLPPFARRLPADPYFGAGLVNPSNRESLAFGGAGSVYGGAPTTPMGNPMPVAGGHPGGLVGVIASEESAKAARRANPNAGGGYGPIPLPNTMMPQMPRTMSMGNLPPPSMYPGGVPPMPQMPTMPGMQGMPMMGQHMDPGQQMQQFMQMQMQMMQNMMAMQQGQMQPQMPQMQQPSQGSFLAPPGAPSRPMSMASHAPSFQSQAPGQGRAMTMMQPPSNWGNLAPQQRPTSSFHPNGGYAPSVHGMNMAGGGPGPGYTPSIAPSERSNIGMPSRYRPVQTGEGSGRSQSMTSSMTLNAFQNQQPVPQQQQAQQAKSTIRVIEKPKGAPKVSTRAVNAEDDDDDGWAEMAKKRNENKYRWGRKKESSNEPALSDLYQSFD